MPYWHFFPAGAYPPSRRCMCIYMLFSGCRPSAKRSRPGRANPRREELRCALRHSISGGCHALSSRCVCMNMLFPVTYAIPCGA